MEATLPFDGRNFTETRLEPFSREDLIAWLETQDPSERYSFVNFDQCLLNNYTIARGGTTSIDDGYCLRGQTLSLYTYDWPQWQSGVVATPPYTYGAALSRARALQAR